MGCSNSGCVSESGILYIFQLRSLAGLEATETFIDGITIHRSGEFANVQIRPGSPFCHGNTSQKSACRPYRNRPCPPTLRQSLRPVDRYSGRIRSISIFSMPSGPGRARLMIRVANGGVRNPGGCRIPPSPVFINSLRQPPPARISKALRTAQPIRRIDRW